jgi:kynurenine formamidase
LEIRRVIDLSHRVDEGTQVYPGDPEVSFEPAANISAEGMNVSTLHLGSHSGTHVDAPYHFIEDGLRIDEMDPKLFIGPATVIDARGKEPRARIRAEDLRPYEDRLSEETIAVIRTGWDRFWGTPRYYDHPFLDVEAARLLLNAGIKTVAIDALNVDETILEGAHPEDYPVHHLVLGAGGTIAENLTNLGAVNFPKPVLHLLPLKLGASDGAPIRAVAIELSE